MNQEEKNTQIDGEQSNENQVKNDSQSDTAEENIDQKIQEAIGEHNIPASELEEIKEEKANDPQEALDPEKKEEENIPEKSIENIDKEEENESQVKQPGRLDKRLAKLYLNNQILQGNENLPTMEEVIEIVSGNSIDKKKEALKNLLSQNKSLRKGDSGKNSKLKAPWETDEDDSIELSPEDHEALIEAEAEEIADKRFSEMKGEISQREFNEDLVKTVEAHPELIEKSKEFNPRIYGAVEKLISKGMKCSEAYDLVVESIDNAKKEASINNELDKQGALSGSVGASNKQVNSGNLTWEELEKIREVDPAKYEKIIKAGNLPEE